MTKEEKNITINSLILFVIASTLVMTLHEFGHFFASILVHAKQISIHHNYTSNVDEGLSLKSTLLIKATGPLVSLIIGVAFQFICSSQTKRNLLFLFNLFMSAFGYIGFFGYLIIAPMFPNGDTGYICYSLGFPIWLTIVIAIIGGIALYLSINGLMKYFVELGSKETIENKVSRYSFIRSLLLFPLLIGIVITTLLNLPIPAFVSLIAPICSPLTFMWGYGNALKKNYSLANANKSFQDFSKLNLWLFVFLFLTVLFNRLLVIGIYLN